MEVTANGPLPDVIVKTNAAGEYAFAKIFPQGNYTVTVLDPITGGLSRERIFLRTDEAVEHDFRLKGRGSVTVRVVDGADVPVEEAFITLTETDFPGNTYEGSIDASNEGELTFNGIFEGDFSVSVSDPFARGGRLSSTLPGPDQNVEAKVRLTTTGTVQGRFFLPDGTPVAFGAMTLKRNGRTIGQITADGTGDNVGGFRVRLRPGREVSGSTVSIR